MAVDPVADVKALFDILEERLVWHCICAVARLDVPDRLARGPLPVPQLAAAVAAHEDSLRRVLRLLCDHGLVTMANDQVGLTSRGRLLCREHPLSQHATFATVSVQDVAHALTETLRTGQAAALTALGVSFWDYLAAHPDQQALFGEQMRQQAQILSLPCVPLVEWSPTDNVADIAGGIGTLLAAVLRAAPQAHGILVDQPQVLERARYFLDSQGVADRCTLQPGDLFAAPPPADIYLLARILHDWDDDHAVQILTSVGANHGSRLRIFERLLPDDDRPDRAKMSDVGMLLLFGGVASAPHANTRSCWNGLAGGWTR
jgi:O-methyltransferase domain